VKPFQTVDAQNVESVRIHWDHLSVDPVMRRAGLRRDPLSALCPTHVLLISMIVHRESTVSTMLWLSSTVRYVWQTLVVHHSIQIAIIIVLIKSYSCISL